MRGVAVRGVPDHGQRLRWPGHQKGADVDKRVLSAGDRGEGDRFDFGGGGPVGGGGNQL